MAGEQARKQIGGARGGKLPSLHIDLHAGKRRSEVQWLNGAVVAKGREVGVPTPVNAALVAVMEELLADPAQIAAWHGAHDRLVQRVQAGATGGARGGS